MSEQRAPSSLGKPAKFPKRKDKFSMVHTIIFKAAFATWAIYEFAKFLKFLWLMW